MDGVYYSELLQIYGGLLTEKHKSVAEAYYSLDLSLAEIAEENGVSRQSVSDALAATRKKLDFYEENLKIYSTKREINAIIDENTLEETKLEKIKNLVGEVYWRSFRDYPKNLIIYFQNSPNAANSPNSK